MVGCGLWAMGHVEALGDGPEAACAFAFHFDVSIFPSAS